MKRTRGAQVARDVPDIGAGSPRFPGSTPR